MLMYNRTSLFGLLNGGTAGLIWGYLFVWVGYMLVFASIAEMASMCVKSPSNPSEYLLILLKGADFWRPIPLGFRVCAAWLAEVPQLSRR
jgi:hypothetical protein